MAYKKAGGTDYIPEQYQQVEKKNNKKVKASVKPGWVRRVTPGIILISLIFLIGMSVVIQQVWLNYLGFQVNQLKKEIVELETENEKLKLKIANNVSLNKIEEIAKTQLGMIYPDNGSVHFIFPSETSVESSDYAVQLASRAMSFGAVTKEEVKTENNYPNQVWFGMIQDFFYHWLARDSKS
ncbi:MAG: cell division protein FtsL [Clostridia bacterium]|nr:cell division protein FtsL [Clostridia bacterium]